MQKFYFYNTPVRKVEEFVPIVPGKVGIYSCGPTVYWSPHLGNMYAYICWDVLVRSLRYVGYDVSWVMNITDVGHLTDDSDTGEDKMEKGAKREGVSVWDVAKKYTDEFLENLRVLNIKTPDVLCKATDNIKEQIYLIKKMEEKGFTYKIDDGMYFDTSKFSGYADFGHLNIEQMKEGARVEVNTQKRNPVDFALWKFSPPVVAGQAKRQMEWESPWGVGFPGWHIECTAMSTKYLGNHFDIHTGGEDHIPVHHTNEVAQAYGAFGQNIANFWIHNAFITINSEKMSKSKGGFATILELSKTYEPMAFRYLSVSSNYKRGLDFSEESMIGASSSLKGLKKHIESLGKEEGSVLTVFRDKFVEKLSDNLSMSEAMAVVYEMLKSDSKPQDKLATWLDFDKVLGFDFKFEEEVVPEEVGKLAVLRLEAKKSKDWARADELRDKISSMGYSIEDTGDSYVVKRLTV